MTCTLSGGCTGFPEPPIVVINGSSSQEDIEEELEKATASENKSESATSYRFTHIQVSYASILFKEL